MSGIVGYISKDKKKDVLTKMTQQIKHRGDKINYHISNDFNLGYVALNTNKDHYDLPYKNQNIILAYDGLIYNKEELQKLLKSKNDLNDLLIELYLKYKTEMVKYLKGGFALSVYDKTNGELFLARDHFGVKPIYYTLVNNEFLYSSEIKPLLLYPDFKKELNEKILKSYLEFSFTPSKETFFKNVFRLDAGEYLIYKDKKVSTKKYFFAEFTENDKSYKKAIEKTNDVIKRSVFNYLADNKDAGSFLSGGVDSSYIVSILKPKNTYTVGYDIEKYSETSRAKELSDILKIKNTVKNISKEEYLNSIDDAIYALEEPSSDPAIISLYILSKEAKKDVDVIFSGEGADELFGGYNTYGADYIYPWYNKIPFVIRKFIANVFKLLPKIKGMGFIIRKGEKLEDSYIGVNKVFSFKESKKILKKNNYIKSTEITKDFFSKTKNKSNLAKMQTIDINFWLVKDILLKADKMTMASGLEVRSPFVDIEVFDLVKTFPPEYKIDSKTTKIILREAAKKEIPNNAFKNKKLGFPVPVRQWVKEEELYEDILNTFNSSIANELFKTKKLIKLLNEHKDDKKDNYRKIWTVYIFLKWYKIYFK